MTTVVPGATLVTTVGWVLVLVVEGACVVCGDEEGSEEAELELGLALALELELDPPLLLLLLLPPPL